MIKKLFPLLILTILLSASVSAAEKSAGIRIPVSCTGENSSETFQYQILPETTQFQTLESDTLFLKNGETGTFEIMYQEPGTYHYLVQQLKGKHSETTYDETVYSVDVYVTEKVDGTMTAEAIAYIKPETEKIDTLLFANYSKTSVFPGESVDTGDAFFKKCTKWIFLMAISFFLIILLIRKDRKEKK